jgi:hypothetical protein
VNHSRTGSANAANGSLMAATYRPSTIPSLSGAQARSALSSDEERVRQMAAELPPGAVRAKGIIATDNEAIEFQRVGTRSQFTRLERTVDQSQIVVIGIPGTLDDDWLADLANGLRPRGYRPEIRPKARWITARCQSRRR